MTQLFNVHIYNKTTGEKKYLTSHRKFKDAEAKAIRELGARGKNFSTYIEEK